MPPRTYHVSLFAIMFAALLCPSFSTMYRGTVVDHNNNHAPIPGVLVSLGYSLYRTTTDSAGRFVLDIPENAVAPRNPASGRPMVSITWNNRRRFIDLTNAPEITKISVFRLNGSLAFCKHITSAERTVQAPVLTTGIYLVNFTRTDRSSFTWKLINSPHQAIHRISARAHQTLHKRMASTDNAFEFIFRHDNYFPLNREMFQPSENLEIEMSVDPSSHVFNQSEIRSYHFTITKEDSLSMEHNAREEEFIPAEFRYGDASFGKVGLRYKGSVYTIPRCFDEEGNRASYPECRNVSLKVRFNEYDDDLRFYAMKRLNLHAMPYDDGKLREMLAYRVFRDMGIHTCRTAFAKVYINNVFRGLFTAVEEIDGRFTKSRWPAWGDGNLYKEAWPFRLNKTYYREALKTNDKKEDSADVGRMVAFYKAINSSTPESFIGDVRPFLDFDYFLRYIVVDRAIHNSDGIMTWYTEGNWTGNHNYYFYEEENAGGKFWLIPWDLNVTFSKTDDNVDGFGLPEWNVAPDSCEPVEIWGGSLAIPPNCDKLTRLTAATLWNDFVAFGEEFCATIFSVDRMKAHVDRLAKLIEPVMNDEPTVSFDTWKDEVKDLRSTMDILHKGFDDYLHDRTPSIDTTGFFTIYPADSGLSIGRINNFEFDSAASIAAWTEARVSDSSTITLVHNTTSPLWGTGDILGSFAFNPFDTTKQYAEWAFIGLKLSRETDLTKLRSIRVYLKCDAPRYCRVFLLSDVYERHDVTDYYGWYGIVPKNGREFDLKAADLRYPDWAAPGNPDLLDSVLATVKGIGFNPNPRFDEDGLLKVTPDSGFIHIDNILFDF